MPLSISHLRAAIDAIDDEIIALLNKRSEYVKQVGMTKKRRQNENRCFIRSGREAEVVRRIYAIFRAGEFPALPAAHMWRMIICASLSLESDLSIAVPATPDNRLYWMAREYFGAFTPVISQNTVHEVIAEVVGGKAEVGVFATDFSKTDERWWLHLPAELKLFACLPFMVSAAEPVKAMAVAKLEPENTGDDTSICKIIAPASLDLEQHLPFPIHILDHSLLDASRTAFLVAVQGFITDIAPVALLDITVLGSYANPIMLDAH